MFCCGFLCFETGSHATKDSLELLILQLPRAGISGTATLPSPCARVFLLPMCWTSSLPRLHSQCPDFSFPVWAHSSCVGSSSCFWKVHCSLMSSRKVFVEVSPRSERSGVGVGVCLEMVAGWHWQPHQRVTVDSPTPFTWRSVHGPFLPKMRGTQNSLFHFGKLNLATFVWDLQHLSLPSGLTSSHRGLALFYCVSCTVG